MTNEKKYTVHLPTPHPKQQAFIENKAKRKVLCAGRRGGKTVADYIVAVQSFLAGLRVLYATPTQEQIDRFWHGCKACLAEPMDAGIYYKNETKHIIEVPNTEQRIRAKTAWNADTLRGDYADVLILDEWQLMNEDAWALVGAPMLLDNDGDAIFSFTPPSFRSRSITKAYDPQHAMKMYRKGLTENNERWQSFHFASHDNPHISEKALEDITYDMTSLAYKQEILAEDIEEIPGALWTRDMIERNRVTDYPELTRIVVGVDPQGKKKDSSETGIVCAGLGRNGHGYVIGDKSTNDRPEGWGNAVVSLFHIMKADKIVVEVNFGGDMVISTIETIDDTVPVKSVSASRGKLIRGEPISAFYEKDKVHHVGVYSELEDEMCSYTADSNFSPNRLDALVWALTELMCNPKQDWASTFSVEKRDSDFYPDGKEENFEVLEH